MKAAPKPATAVRTEPLPRCTECGTATRRRALIRNREVPLCGQCAKRDPRKGDNA